MGELDLTEFLGIDFDSVLEGVYGYLLFYWYLFESFIVA